MINNFIKMQTSFKNNLKIITLGGKCKYKTFLTNDKYEYLATNNARGLKDIL